MAEILQKTKSSTNCIIGIASLLRVQIVHIVMFTKSNHVYISYEY
jgi:hypothetical protein